MKSRFTEVAQYGDEFAAMQTFAKSFDHEITPMRNGRIIAFQNGPITFGYAAVAFVPIAYPAFHPELTTPRRVIEILDGWKHHCQIQHGGDGLIGVPVPTERQTFPSEMILKAGFEDLNRQLFYLKQEE